MNNILLVNICLLATVAVVCSYSMVQGFGGNSFLSASPPAAPGHVSETEGRSNFWARTVTRHRRDASEHERGQFDMCCNVEKSPDTGAYMEKMAPIFKECQDENKSDESGGTRRRNFMECVAKKGNIIDDTGKLNAQAIKADLNEAPLQDYQKGAIDAAVTLCVEKAEGAKGNPLQIFHWCLGREFMRACPTDKQDDSNRCVRLRGEKQ